jgi:putative chitinase
MTPADLSRALPYCSAVNAQRFAAPLTGAMAKWQITTPARQAAFLANIAAETASLSELREQGSGAGYVGILGNLTLADAELYIGRGCLQITGRDNYAACGAALGLPLLVRPQLLEEPEWAAQSAGWFWETHGLNELADRDPNAFATICERINGGFNGINERIACWLYARSALGCQP